MLMDNEDKEIINMYQKAYKYFSNINDEKTLNQLSLLKDWYFETKENLKKSTDEDEQEGLFFQKQQASFSIFHYYDMIQ